MTQYMKYMCITDILSDSNFILLTNKVSNQYFSYKTEKGKPSFIDEIVAVQVQFVLTIICFSKCGRILR